MKTYTDSRKQRRAVETTLDSIKLMEKMNGNQVVKNLGAIEATAQDIEDLEYKHMVAEYLDPETNKAPKLYAIKGCDFAREHSNLNTQDQWDKLKAKALKSCSSSMVTAARTWVSGRIPMI